MNENKTIETKASTPGERVYSAKIRERRRSLFPQRDVSNEDVEANPLNLSPECMEYQDISNIPSTEAVRRILLTPQRKLISADIGSSPSRTSEGRDHISSLSLAEILKTPKDSTTQTEEAPKLSRKSIGEASDKDDTGSTSLKNSKVRTNLFQDVEISLSTKQFYRSTDSQKTTKRTPVSSTQPKKEGKPRIRKSLQRRRLFGQINAGVKHKIRKKNDRSLKLSRASVSHIKTYKSDFALKSKFDEYLKDLKEINENKKVKLIQHLPSREELNGSETNRNCLKRSNVDTEQIICKKLKSSKPESTTPPNELTFGNESLEDEINVPIHTILNTLDESIGEDKENRSKDKEGILSPTSELSTMTSGLKLGTPKKVRNLTAVFQSMSEENTQEASTSSKSQYYPLFYPKKRSIEKGLEKECSVKKKKMKISSDQMLLDAGQKKFGLIECAECNYVYHAGDPKDEHLHENHHSAMNILQFNGWKNERIMEQVEGRIIQILPGDSKQWIDKVKRLTEFINREMGYHDIEVDLSTSMVFLYIFNKSIVGCLIAESKTTANKILTAHVDVDLCSLEEYPVVCGVSRLWIASGYRKKGVATKLMETLRKNFLSDRMIDKSEIALSAPTREGKLFATKYFETPNFYTYMN